MFSVHCPAHGREVLLTTDQIERLEHTDLGIVVHWVCWCGERAWFLTGRPSPRRRAIA